MEISLAIILSCSTLFVFVKFALFYLFKSQVLNNDQKIKKLPCLPPGPRPWPIVGNLPEMMRAKYSNSVAQWIHKFMNEMNTEIACIRLGKVHVIPVTCPEISREFLKRQDAIFASRPLTMASHLLTKGYLSTALVPLGDQWKKMRALMSREVLSHARHQWLYEKRVEEADHLMHYVHNQCKNSDEGGFVNVRVAARHYCGNVIRRLVFNKRYFGEGKEDGGPGFEEEEHVEAIFTCVERINSFCVSDFLPFLKGLDLEGDEKVMEGATRILGMYHDTIIDDRIKQWRDGKKTELEDLLDVLVTLKDDNEIPLLSANEIKAQINEMMLAAVDNPSNAVEWALAEMLNQPEMLQKAIDELDRVVGKDRLVQESDFPQLNYIKACAREAFRLHPIFPFLLPHMSVADTTVANYFIPKGSHVLLSRVGVGRNPKVWDEPYKFKPERHLHDCRGDEVVLVEPDLRLLSFSTGRRGCKGVVLGSSMTTMLLARLLQGFKWSIPYNQRSIDLNEGKNDLYMAKPLLAIAKPRLPPHVYPTSYQVI